MQKSERGLMIGRFQPFHRGHLYLVQQILSECNELVIAIGSSQFNYTFSNPFTAGERIHMIHEALVEENVSLDKVYIIPIPNSENNSIWLQHLKSMVPKFNVLYTGNAFVKGLVIGDENVQIKNPDFLEEGKYNGTHIRTCIVSNKNWKKLVPNSVYRMINRMDGISRVRMLYGTQGISELRSEIDVRDYPNIK
ncbi:MAG: nicotinamide-nucleotide adenylyltransferase [Nitrososphaeraceae archaeon]